jgi:hypothetical protein
MTPNDFRGGLPALNDDQTNEMIAAYRARYTQLARDPQADAIIAGMEAKLAAALAADGKTLPVLSPAENLRLLRVGAAARGNGLG